MDVPAGRTSMLRERLPPEVRRGHAALRLWVVPLPEAAAAVGLAPSAERLAPAAYALNWSAAPSGSAALPCKGLSPKLGPAAEAASAAGAARRLAGGPPFGVGAVAEVTAAAGGFCAGASRRGAEAAAPGARSTLCKAAAAARFRALCAACAGSAAPAGDPAARAGSAACAGDPAAHEEEGRALGIGGCRAERWEGCCGAPQAPSPPQQPPKERASGAAAASAVETAQGTPAVVTATRAPCEAGCMPLALDVRGTYHAAKRSTRHARLWAALLQPPTPFAGWTRKPQALEEFDLVA